MQYTLRNVPSSLDDALRSLAREEGKSLNQVTLEALERSLGLAGEPLKRRDLSDVAGSWHEDPEFDRALEDQRCVEPEVWR